MAEDTAAEAISVVVPVYNGERTIGSTMEHLFNQSLQPLEIIAVDDGSTDKTAEILKSFGSRIRVYSKRNGGPASARNQGIIASKGSLVAFTDSDCCPDRDWLAELAKGFRTLRIAGVGGQVRRASAGLIAEHTDLKGGLNPSLAPGGKFLCLVTANACFRRQALLEANLFDERFENPGGEDSELSVRISSLGHELTYVSSAVVFHRHRGTLWGLLNNNANYGEGWYILGSLWPEQQWENRSYFKMLRSMVAVRFLSRSYQHYRKDFDRKKAFSFTFLDYCQALGQNWGYMRGARKFSTLSLANGSCEAKTKNFEGSRISSSF